MGKKRNKKNKKKELKKQTPKGEPIKRTVEVPITRDGEEDILILECPTRKLEQRLQEKYDIPYFKHRVLYYAKRLKDERNKPELLAAIEDKYILATSELEEAAMQYKIHLYSLLIQNKSEDWLDGVCSDEWLWIISGAEIAFKSIRINELYMEIFLDIKNRISGEAKPYTEEVIAIMDEVEQDYISLKKKLSRSIGVSSSVERRTSAKSAPT